MEIIIRGIAEVSKFNLGYASRNGIKVTYWFTNRLLANNNYELNKSQIIFEPWTDGIMYGVKGMRGHFYPSNYATGVYAEKLVVKN